jgi:hypothetical protein
METESPTLSAEIPDTFSNRVSVEVEIFMLDIPEAPNIPGRPLTVKCIGVDFRRNLRGHPGLHQPQVIGVELRRRPGYGSGRGLDLHHLTYHHVRRRHETHAAHRHIHVIDVEHRSNLDVHP